MTRKSIWVLALIALMALGVSANALAKGKKSTSGVVYAGVTHVEGDDIYVAGEFNDSVLGRGAIVYITKVTGDDSNTIHVDAQKITIYTTKGSLSGKGGADQTFNEDGTSTIGNGTFDLRKGTGKYKDHSFKGTFDGSFTDGVYTFNYNATFK